MWKSFNPNPKGNHTTDCAVRALSAVLGISWVRAYDELTDEARELALMPDSKAVIGRVLWGYGWCKYILEDTCPDCYTAGRFCRDFPKGRYILAFDNHVAAVIDGDIYDTWDSRGEIPLFYWRKE